MVDVPVTKINDGDFVFPVKINDGDVVFPVKINDGDVVFPEKKQRNSFLRLHYFI